MHFFVVCFQAANNDLYLENSARYLHNTLCDVRLRHRYSKAT